METATDATEFIAAATTRIENSQVLMALSQAAGHESEIRKLFSILAEEILPEAKSDRRDGRARSKAPLAAVFQDACATATASSSQVG